jgi:hypothetical protein
MKGLVLALDFKLETLVTNKEQISVYIFNMDYSYQPGSHWTTLLLDPVKKRLLYFDSLGNPPPEEIECLLEKIRTALDVTIVVNLITVQKSNSECGTYAIYFVLYMLQNGSGSFENFIYNKKSFRVIVKLKDYLRGCLVSTTVDIPVLTDFILSINTSLTRPALPPTTD